MRGAVEAGQRLCVRRSEGVVSGEFFGAEVVEVSKGLFELGAVLPALVACDVSRDRDGGSEAEMDLSKGPEDNEVVPAFEQVFSGGIVADRDDSRAGELGEFDDPVVGNACGSSWAIRGDGDVISFGEFGGEFAGGLEGTFCSGATDDVLFESASDGDAVIAVTAETDED